jgi:hypothetical protein
VRNNNMFALVDATTTKWRHSALHLVSRLNSLDNETKTSYKIEQNSHAPSRTRAFVRRKPHRLPIGEMPH